MSLVCQREVLWLISHACEVLTEAFGLCRAVSPGSCFQHRAVLVGAGCYITPYHMHMSKNVLSKDFAKKGGRFRLCQSICEAQ